MFKLASRNRRGLWFWDDEDLSGEVFQLSKLKQRKMSIWKLYMKYPKGLVERIARSLIKDLKLNRRHSFRDISYGLTIRKSKHK